MIGPLKPPWQQIVHNQVAGFISAPQRSRRGPHSPSARITSGSSGGGLETTARSGVIGSASTRGYASTPAIACSRSVTGMIGPLKPPWQQIVHNQVAGFISAPHRAEHACRGSIPVIAERVHVRCCPRRRRLPDCFCACAAKLRCWSAATATVARFTAHKAVHRRLGALKPPWQQIVHNQVAGFIILIGGADNGDRTGIKQLVQVVNIRHFIRRVPAIPPRRTPFPKDNKEFTLAAAWKFSDQGKRAVVLRRGATGTTCSPK